MFAHTGPVILSKM